MRRTCLLVLSLVLICAGCQRSTLNVVPDRRGHAYVLGEAGGGAGGDRSRSRTPVTSTDSTPGPGETVIRVEYGDSLYKIAERHNCELRWLIERNALTRRVQAGDRLIVPAR